MGALRESLGLDLVVRVYVAQSAQCTLNCRDPICSRQFSRVVNRHSRENVRRALGPAYILATMPVYDPTELSRANWVATVQRSLSRLKPGGYILTISPRFTVGAA